MALKDYVHAMQELSPTYRKLKSLREKCERMDGATRRLNDKIGRMEKQIGRITPQARLNLVEVNIVSHCNLNCRWCSHFSPVAVEEYLPVESAEKDFSRLAELSEGGVNRIHIMGGEPLLHPQCCDFLKLARKHFPWSVIRLVTNGTLLSAQHESFWSCLSDNWITLSPTKYPVEVDWGFVEDRCSEHHIIFMFFNDPDLPKTMTRFALDRLGWGDPRENFRDCDCANNTVVLHGGRMYPCEVIPTVRHLNRQFNMDLAVTGNDSIDIHKAGSMTEILSFLAKPAPFCRYCDVNNRVKSLEWETCGQHSFPRMADWVNC